ncbi:MAG: rhamnogalacturonan acetylesterase [Verrucomicrobiae bacterium]|nr:rhamnogalacturonan acetylesterase [Verrucomicrobiae bacterium]MCP5532425.1 rhamnogalacturonan acetylesterase [Akkermansiaceae bacterium]MCP5542669.1 rhamnogalacturonan acetylesterase [Akkermansiaceae bacterium]
MKPKFLPIPAVILMTIAARSAEFRFDFGPGETMEGCRQVTSASLYSKEAGFGFLPGPKVDDVAREFPNALTSDACTSSSPFLFAVDVPEGNYEVRVVLGNPIGASDTTVRMGTRQLVLRNVAGGKGDFTRRSFTANVRTPEIPGGKGVGLKPRETDLARWESRLTFEFSGSHPSVAGIDIRPAPEATTVFIAGDSTVTDQGAEPWAGWGQMLPAFFDNGTAVSNHAESGLALFSFRSQRRLDKVLSMMKPGDHLLIQFGHNDQKDRRPGSGAFTTYKADLVSFVKAAREKKGFPVLVTPMERRRWKGDEPQQTLSDYAEAVRQVATEEKVPLIDLHAMSLRFYRALGPEPSKRAFVHYPAGTWPDQKETLKDDTHHNAYGAYELARCVVEGIRGSVPALAERLREDIPAFDPASPDDADGFRLPPSPSAAVLKPDGN